MNASGEVAWLMRCRWPDPFGRKIMIANDRGLQTTSERIAWFHQQLAHLRRTEANPANYRAAASGFLAEIDRMQLQVREYFCRLPTDSVATATAQLGGVVGPVAIHLPVHDVLAVAVLAGPGDQRLGGLVQGEIGADVGGVGGLAGGGLACQHLAFADEAGRDLDADLHVQGVAGTPAGGAVIDADVVAEPRRLAGAQQSPHLVELALDGLGDAVAADGDAHGGQGLGADVAEFDGEAHSAPPTWVMARRCRAAEGSL